MKHEVTSTYTKKALSASLKKFMETKPFSKITVSEIVADCGLNRKTFYYHFEDTRDLLKWTFEQEAIDVVKSFDLLIDYEDAIIFVIEYLEKNQHFLNCVYDSVGQNELKRFLFNDFSGIARMIITGVEKKMGKEISEDFRKLLIYFYTDGMVGLLVEWLHGEIKYDKKTAVRYILTWQ
ncbi:MAG: TetR/AcrR family transcriptional regulator C-terminal domain-containing protein [Oscillospiraceae bacterium]|nr:TetR/AcrR family transcriptional regulator C-terminal domain-containing protein [Oscillospiraceae bacterium]